MSRFPPPPAFGRRLSSHFLQNATRFALHHGVINFAKAVRLTPVQWANRRQVEVLANHSYKPGSKSRAHRMDILRPRQTTNAPIVLYVHGGGFGLLSKDSHWHLATAWAAQGFWVANINYRLAPKHPYPAALEDVADAFCFVREHAHRLGGDPTRIILAGESAGGNLVTALALMLAHDFQWPWAKRLFALNVQPTAVLPACGLLQVSEPRRYELLAPHLSVHMHKHIHMVCTRYTRNSSPAALAIGLDSPLQWLEQHVPTRALPPFFITCGDADPILSDSQRLYAALQKQQAPCELRLYPRQGHAFHALPWRPQAKQHAADSIDFVKRYLQKLSDWPQLAEG